MHRHSAVLIASLLMNGCGAPTEEAAARDPVPTSVVPQTETPDVVRTDLQQLQTRRAALQGEYDALRIERDRLADRVGAHQADGERRLAELKSQLQSVDGAARDGFAERARNEMESALMMDEEYRAQLQQADEELQRTERELRDLREREAVLRK